MKNEIKLSIELDESEHPMILNACDAYPPSKAGDGRWIFADQYSLEEDSGYSIDGLSDRLHESVKRALHLATLKVDKTGNPEWDLWPKFDARKRKVSIVIVVE